MPADPQFTARELALAFKLDKNKINNSYKSGVVAQSLTPAALGGNAGRPLRQTEAMALVLGIKLVEQGLPAAWVAVAVEKEMKRIMADDAVWFVMAAEDGARDIVYRRDGYMAPSLDEFDALWNGKTIVFVPLEVIRNRIKEIVPSRRSAKGGWGSGREAYEKAMAEYRARETRARKKETAA